VIAAITGPVSVVADGCSSVAVEDDDSAVEEDINSIAVEDDAAAVDDTIRVWQTAPVYFDVHEHVNEFNVSIHVPLCWHGREAHSSTSV